MARRVTWTNNSTSYDGTEAYRDTTIDPQNLPEPIATVDPVAQGATVEYIDLTGSGDQCYAVRDFDSSGDGALSEAYCFDAPADLSTASVGDEIEGGIYAGTITYADAREFHIIFALASGDIADTPVKTSDTSSPGTDDEDDGLANTEAMAALSLADHPAADYCLGYSADGFDDWYLPARNEIAMVSGLTEHPEFSDNAANNRFGSTERNSSTVWARRFDTAGEAGILKTDTTGRVRPIRRVPV